LITNLLPKCADIVEPELDNYHSNKILYCSHMDDHLVCSRCADTETEILNQKSEMKMLVVDKYSAPTTSITVSDLVWHILFSIFFLLKKEEICWSEENIPFWKM